MFASPAQVAIVTDSTADLPGELIERYQISVVPNLVIINGKSLADGQDITREEFYTRLPEIRPLPTTATASSGIYQELYQRLLDQGYKAILSIHTSSLLSGIINAASGAAQMFAGRVQVIDSQSISMGLGWQVLAAAEAAWSGLSAEKILEILDAIRPRLRVIAMLDTLEYLRRSGRVSWACASLGNFLRIKLFIEVNAGKVLNYGQARTYRAGINRLRDILLEQAPYERLAILHTNAESEANQFLEAIHGSWSQDPIVVNVTTVVGTHIGPNCLGFAGLVAD